MKAKRVDMVISTRVIDKTGKVRERLPLMNDLMGAIRSVLPGDAKRVELDVKFSDGGRIKLEGRK